MPKSNLEQNVGSTSLAFAPTTKEPKLLVTEMVVVAPKDFVLTRLYDLKDLMRLKSKEAKKMAVEVLSLEDEK